MIALLLLIINFVLSIPAPTVTVPPVGVLTGPIAPIAMAPDGSWIAFVSSAGLGDDERMGRVQVWDLRTGTLDRSFPVPGIWRAAAVAVSPDGRWLAYPGYENNSRAIRLYDFRTGKGVRTITGVGDDSHPIGFSRDGKEMYSSGTGGRRREPRRGVVYRRRFEAP